MNYEERLTGLEQKVDEVLGLVRALAEARKTERAASVKRKKASPTYEQVEAYAVQRGNVAMLQEFWEHFTASDWYDTKGNPVLSWKQKWLTWERYRKNTVATRKISDEVMF